MHKHRLTALIIDDTLLRLLGVELAQRAVLGVLLDISLPGPHPHPAGHTAGRPADPLGHHARRRLCQRGDDKTKSSFHFSTFAWKYPHGGRFQVSALFCQLQTPEMSNKQIENKYIKAFQHDTLILYERKKRIAASKAPSESLKMDNSDIKKGTTKSNLCIRRSYIAP